MSFHSLVTASAVWPADLVTAGVVAAVADVYTGRRRQQVTRPAEVWLEQVPGESLGQGMQGLAQYAYRVHYFRRGNDGPGRRGKRNLDDVEDAVEVIRQRYHGACPFISTVSGMVHAEATAEEVDNDPEDSKAQEGVVRVVFTVAE